MLTAKKTSITTLPPLSAMNVPTQPAIVAVVESAVKYAAVQLAHHSEAVFHAGIQIELQGRGATVQNEVPIEVPFVLSWSGASVTVGSVRVDCVATLGNHTVVVEVKRARGNHAAQLQKYADIVDPSWGVALATPESVVWVRHPTA